MQLSIDRLRVKGKMSTRQRTLTMTPCIDQRT
jgi:hypothetical protein